MSKGQNQIITGSKAFSGAMTLDLTDEEIKTAYESIITIVNKWRPRFVSKFNDVQNFGFDDAWDLLEQFEDEIKTTLASKASMLATVDVLPVLEGKPPVVEIIGVMPGASVNAYGMDHEKKEWEVKKATARDEDYLGQKD